MRRSQVSQAFTYIAAILVIGAIAILGARSIMSLFSANCEAKDADFTRKFVSFVDQYSDLGSVHIETLGAPCDAVQVCFVSASSMGPLFADADPVVDESVREQSYNVFVKGDFTSPVSKSMKLETSDDLLVCAPVQNGNVKLKFSGMGRTTLVEDAS